MKKELQTEEQHYRGQLGQSWVATDHFSPNRVTSLYLEFSDSEYVTPEMRQRALEAAARADVARGGKVLVNLADARHVELNDQNAPLDGNAPVGEGGKLPKIRTGKQRQYGW